jgi:hypothetical protein
MTVATARVRSATRAMRLPSPSTSTVEELVSSAGATTAVRTANGLSTTGMARFYRIRTPERRTDAGLVATAILLSEGEKVLGAFDGFADPAEEELKVFAALDEVEFGGIDHE